jgi:uncharacterized protein (DUF1697 family)
MNTRVKVVRKKTNRRYVALLRGINVGGNNIIKMQDLKHAFENMGCTNIRTYIQSGNVVFDSPVTDEEKLCANIEKTLSKEFAYASSVVLITQTQLKKIVASAPPSFGREPTKYRYDVLFLKPHISVRALLKDIPINPAVDIVHAGKGVLFYSRLIAHATKSRMNKVILLPAYKSMTIRNWNTTMKLRDLSE